MAAELTIGQYLIQCLEELEIRFGFGIPGDYVLKFYRDIAEKSSIRIFNCTQEDRAGFAADGSFRISGVPGLYIGTWVVGTLNVMPVAAGCFAEQVPLVILTGAPGIRERDNNPLIHHKARTFSDQFEAFEKFCCSGTRFENPEEAFSEIRRVLNMCVAKRQPVYIELPRDLVDYVPNAEALPLRDGFVEEATNGQVSRAVEKAVEKIRAAKRPVLNIGVEVHRFGCSETVEQLVDQGNFPFAVTMLGKSALSDRHPNHLGLCAGGSLSDSSVAEYFASSDCPIHLGVKFSDLVSDQVQTLPELSQAVVASQCPDIINQNHHDALNPMVVVNNLHNYPNVPLRDFVDGLVESGVRAPDWSHPASTIALPKTTRASRTWREAEQRQNALGSWWLSRTALMPENASSAPITVRRVIDLLNHFIASSEKEVIVICDVGDSLFAGVSLKVAKNCFISPAYFTSMGPAVPYAMAVAAHKPDAHKIVLCGDGAFQMTGASFGDLVRYDLNATIIVFDNGRFGTEDVLEGGQRNEHNRVWRWKYSKAPQYFSGGSGYRVRSERDFVRALIRALRRKKSPSILDVELAETDYSPRLEGVGVRLKEKVAGG